MILCIGNPFSTFRDENLDRHEFHIMHSACSIPPVEFVVYLTKLQEKSIISKTLNIRVTENYFI
jgi:hypothetical protein